MTRSSVVRRLTTPLPSASTNEPRPAWRSRRVSSAGEPDQFVFGYPFKAGTVLQAGETMMVDPGGDPGDDTRLLRHVGRGSFVLADGKGVVSLRTTDDLVTDCAAWGDAACR